MLVCNKSPKVTRIIGRVSQVFPTRPYTVEVWHRHIHLNVKTQTSNELQIQHPYSWEHDTDRFCDVFEMECLTICFPWVSARCLISVRIVLFIFCHKRGSQGLGHNIRIHQHICWGYHVCRIHEVKRYELKDTKSQAHCQKKILASQTTLHRIPCSSKDQICDTSCAMQGLCWKTSIVTTAGLLGPTPRDP